MELGFHRKYVGMSGSGKTTKMIWDILEDADREDCGIAVFFPHREHGEKLLLHLVEHMHGDRLLVDDLADNKSVLAKSHLHISQSDDPFTRMTENEEARDAFLSLPTRRRKDFDDLAERPMIEKYSKVAVAAYQYLAEWVPLYLLPSLLVRDHPMQIWALQNITDEEVRYELQRAADLNPHEQVSHVIPGERFLTGFLNRAHMIARTSLPPTFLLPGFLKNCGNGLPGIYVSLGGGSKEAIQDNMVSDVQQIVFDAKANPSDIPRFVYRDESVNYGLIHTFEAEALNTTRAFNLFFRDAVQQYRFANPDIEVDFRQNTDSIIFRQGSRKMGEQCADDLMLLTDRQKIHHVDVTRRQFTKHKIDTRKSVGTWVGPDGSKGSSENVSPVLIPEVEERDEERANYESPDHQVFWNARDLMKLDTGVCWIAEAGRMPYQSKVPWLPKICAFPEDYPNEIEQCLRAIKKRPEYRSPIPWRIVVPPKEQPQPKPNGTAAKMRGNKQGKG